MIISDLKTPLYLCRIPEILSNSEIRGTCRLAWNDTGRNAFHHDGVHINNIAGNSFDLKLIDRSDVDRRNHVYRCNKSNLPDGCIYTCINVELHSVYQVSLITSRASKLYAVKNMYFRESPMDKRRGNFSFTPPSGSYDYIDLRCSTEDALCFEQHWLTNITIGCYHCDHISLFPITRGVKYNCIVYTLKNNIFLAAFDDFYFNTGKDSLKSHSNDIFLICLDLEPVLYNQSSQINTSSVYLNFTPQSDFTSVTLVCSSHLSMSGSCPSTSATSYNCSTNLTFNGTLGCNYQCTFNTLKSYYGGGYSNTYSLSFRTY